MRRKHRDSCWARGGAAWARDGRADGSAVNQQGRRADRPWPDIEVRHGFTRLTHARHASRASCWTCPTRSCCGAAAGSTCRVTRPPESRIRESSKRPVRPVRFDATKSGHDSGCGNCSPIPRARSRQSSLTRYGNQSPDAARVDARATRHEASDVRQSRVGERDNLDAEHEQLRREVDTLRQEHAALEQKPVNTQEHEAHRRRLKNQIAKLQAHIRRLQSPAVSH